VKKQVQQPELFAPRAPATDTVALKLKERIEKIDVDSLSARDALSLVYELKELGSVSRSSAVLKR
jgi:hypothetical protein